MIRILFVCTGNVCRSPMAEGLLCKLLRGGERQEDFVVGSAGTSAMEGSPATASSVEVCAERGIDISGHISRAITREMIDSADLILTMEAGHRQRVLALVPDAAEKCFVITKYAGGSRGAIGILDPIGQPKEEYEVTFREIQASVEAAMPKILALSEDGSEPTRNRTV